MQHYQQKNPSVRKAAAVSLCKMIPLVGPKSEFYIAVNKLSQDEFDDIRKEMVEACILLSKLNSSFKSVKDYLEKPFEKLADD
jgi:hypothetical protein